MAATENGFPTVAPPDSSDTFRLLHSDITSTRALSTRPPRSRQAARPSGKGSSTRDKRDSFSAAGKFGEDSDVKSGATAAAAGDDDDDSGPAKAKDKRKVRPGSYEHLGLNRQLCQSLAAAGYNFPTPIQRKVIPPLLAGHDVVAMARTGSGKTAAFLAPLLHRLLDPAHRPPTSVSARRNGPRVLVVAPTRELVLQQLKFCRLYTKRMAEAPRAAVVVGGTPLDAQFEALAVCPPILFATPGRLLQLLVEMGARRALTLATVETLVLDEADRLFEGTLAVDTARLLDALADRRTETLSARQTVLVSATMPLALADFSRTRLRPGLVVARLDAERVLPPTLALAFFTARAESEKDAALCVVARRILAANKSAVVFAATHRRVDYLTRLVGQALGVEVASVHGNMDQLARQDAVSSFRGGKAQLLVVTDVAARGIDLPALDVVINYDSPATPKLFVHRVGRAGRAGRFGIAISLVSADEMPYVLDVHLFVGRQLQLAGEENEHDGGNRSDEDDKDEDKGEDEESNAEDSDSNEDNQQSKSIVGSEDAFVNNVLAMDKTFIVGTLPKCAIDEELETVRREQEDIEVEKMYKSARNAHRLYTRTRGSASGESVRRAKALRLDDGGCRRALGVHPWLKDMESATEKEAAREVAKLSGWRPKQGSVAAPHRIVMAKENGNEDEDLDVEGKVVDEEEDGDSGHVVPIPMDDEDSGQGGGKRKLSARQQALEAERQQFYMATTRSAGERRNEQALSVRGGGRMGDGLGAYRELDTAAMDVTADGDAGLLRTRHTGGTSAKFWDRVSKKFVKGGATAATSKRNLHVRSREAMAVASASEAARKKKGSDEKDGDLFRKWLGKNRQAVQMMTDQAESGSVGGGAGGGMQKGMSGLGSGDFRKGAFGRKARVAAAVREKRLREGAGGSAQPADATRFGAGGNNSRRGAGRKELKTADEIRKTRKLKAKADLRRVAAVQRKAKAAGRRR